MLNLNLNLKTFVSTAKARIRILLASPELSIPEHTRALQHASTADTTRMDTRRKILISVDESNASDKVLDWAMENLYRSGVCKTFDCFPPPRRLLRC